MANLKVQATYVSQKKFPGKYIDMERQRENAARQMNNTRKDRRTTIFNFNRGVNSGNEETLTKEEKLKKWKEEKKKKKEEEMKNKRPPFNRFTVVRHTGFSPFGNTKKELGKAKKKLGNLFSSRNKTLTLQKTEQHNIPLEQTVKFLGKKSFDFQMPSTSMTGPAIEMKKRELRPRPIKPVVKEKLKQKPQSKSTVEPSQVHVNNVVPPFEEGEKEPINFVLSPFVQTERGKKQRPKPDLLKIRLADILMEKEIEEPPNGPTFQRKRMIVEKERLMTLVVKWDYIKSNENVPENIVSEIERILGQTRLLVILPSSKFEQFNSLIEICQQSNDGRYSYNDLDGFWDMISIQILKLDNSYKHLEELKNKNWEQGEPENRETHKHVKKTTEIKHKKKIQSRIKDTIMARRKEMLQSKGNITEDSLRMVVQQNQDAESSHVDDEKTSASLQTPEGNTLLQKVDKTKEKKLSIAEINLNKVRRSRTSFGQAALRNSLREKSISSPLVIIQNGTPVVKSILKSAEKFKGESYYKEKLDTPSLSTPKGCHIKERSIMSSKKKVLFCLPSSPKKSLEEPTAKKCLEYETPMPNLQVNESVAEISLELEDCMHRLFLEGEKDKEEVENVSQGSETRRRGRFKTQAGETPTPRRSLRLLLKNSPFPLEH